MPRKSKIEVRIEKKLRELGEEKKRILTAWESYSVALSNIDEEINTLSDLLAGKEPYRRSHTDVEAIIDACEIKGNIESKPSNKAPGEESSTPLF